MSHILDISRFVSRAHLPFDTGIDRVERAFIKDTLQRFKNPHFIARLGQDFTVVDGPGMQAFLQREATQNWPRAKGKDVFRLKLTKAQRRIRSALRISGKAHCKIDGLPAVFANLELGKFDYTNVGHTNLSARFLKFIRRAGAESISVFVHDVIPLDYPQYCRPDRLKYFAANMHSVMDYCDQIYCNSQYTADRISSHFKKTPTMRVVHLAVHQGTNSDEGPHLELQRPTFATLGTVEPRKNLTFMLDVWECLAVALPADKMPDLIVIGKRGWESKDVLDRLDAANNVIELSNLTDEQVRSHLRASTALLFPSLVEGYGLPVQEALALKTPVVASDIPVFKELFADVATLLPIKEPQVWVDFIINVMSNPDIAFPNLNYFNKTKTWDDFFTDIYINLTGE